MSAPDVNKLQQELRQILESTERKRKVVGISQKIIYLLALSWFVFMGWNYFRVVNSDGVQYEEVVNIVTEDEPIYSYDRFSENVFKYFMIGLVVYYICIFTFNKSYTAFAKQEWDVIAKIVRTLFPKAEFSRYANAPSPTIVHASKFFTGISNHSYALAITLFASLKVMTEGKPLYITDLGVTRAMHQDSLGGIIKTYTKILSLFFKSLSGGRAENAILDFRGMFAWIEFEEQFKGDVVVLPDHLEGKVGYLAKSIQSLKSVGGNKLVTLEDPEFEKYFAVYTSDEVFARSVLTPAMMLDITRLRKKYGRDIMVSFTGRRFYFAVNMPDGFLNLRAGSVKNDHLVEEIYNDIQIVSAISQELDLKQRQRFVAV